MMGSWCYLPEALQAFLGVVFAGSGELDPLPQQPRGVVPLHHLQRSGRPERSRAAEPRHCESVGCFFFLPNSSAAEEVRPFRAQFAFWTSNSDGPTDR